MAAVRSLVTYVLVSLYVLIIGPIGMLFVLLFRAKGLLYQLGHAGVALALGLAGIRYSVLGREHVPKGRAVVFARITKATSTRRSSSRHCIVACTCSTKLN